MKRSSIALLLIALACLMVFPICGVVQLYSSGIMRNNAQMSLDDDGVRLVEKLCENYTDDKEKVEAFYKWITENIEYDYAFNDSYQFFNVREVLRKRKGVCFDYSNLFSAFCRKEGIPCYAVDGYKKIDSSSKHTWSRVYYDGTWWNLDLTYDAVCKKNGKKPYGFHNIGSEYDCTDEDYIITRFY